MDGLFVDVRSVRSGIFHQYGVITIADERLQNIGLNSALQVFKQVGMFILPHLVRHGAISSEDPPHLATFYGK
jgi:hypothetical protein